ncbi:MAG TPA: hypothetical protein VGS58_17300 [Candidatus Sulfopaludibacter sp.]|nr:hypothetical protein [Candidatus Sulfopaludibacter sp.]
MKRRVWQSALMGVALTGWVPAQERTVTWTGWFSDSQCAASRAAGGTFTETNPECAKSCIAKGAAAVFVSEQAHAVFGIKDYPSAIEDLGYHVELRGMADDAAKTIRVREVKRLEYVGASCSRPRKR